MLGGESMVSGEIEAISGEDNGDSPQFPAARANGVTPHGGQSES